MSSLNTHLSIAGAPTQPTAPPNMDQKLRAAAQELEATFLSEMLKSTGLGEMPDAFGGGAGEDQFASFLRLEQARSMAQAGGLGLSEVLFEALKERTNVVD